MNIQKNISLLPYNTFAVNIQADFFVEVTNEQDIFDLISTDVFSTQTHFILGGGANILFTKNYTGLIIKVSLLGKEVVKEEGNTVYIKIGAGEDWHKAMMRALEQGYVGGENLVLIPGEVGSAPVGNIGAYGKEAKDIISEVEGIDIVTKEKKVWTNNECKFTYRESIFKNELKNKVIVTAVTFVFEKQSADYIPNIQYNDIQESIGEQGIDPSKITALQLANIIIKIREGKMPDRKKTGTAGSFFKNPVVGKDQFEKLLLEYPQLKGNEIHTTGAAFKLSAGQLIEFAGFKGKSEGLVATYDKHALVIINKGGASGGDIRAFAQAIQKKVLELFDVQLEPEVIIM
ncbi:MAG: UDP-N-acetylmuramate dehydrogenase [Candidatus Absconditabacterales bacterium]